MLVLYPIYVKLLVSKRTPERSSFILAANNSVITQHNHASDFYYYGRFVTECLEKRNRRAAGAPNEIILTSDEDPVGLLCVEGYKYTEAMKVAAGLCGIPVVYYNRDKNCITRQFVEQVY